MPSPRQRRRAGAAACAWTDRRDVGPPSAPGRRERPESAQTRRSASWRWGWSRLHLHELALDPGIADGVVALDDAGPLHRGPAPGQILDVELSLLAGGKAQGVAGPLVGAVGDYFGLETLHGGSPKGKGPPQGPWL